MEASLVLMRFPLPIHGFLHILEGVEVDGAALYGPNLLLGSWLLADLRVKCDVF